jgi:ABC-type transport system involved in cytochrome bd biosynthesis fused ATPase/permease subunit
MIVNFVILGVLVVGGIPLAGQLIAVTRGLTSKRERELDERQLTARLRAFATAHQATTLVIAAVLVVTMVADRDGRESQIPGAALFLILFALLATHALLPLVVAAWQTPDPPPADDDEGEEQDS